MTTEPTTSTRTGRRGWIVVAIPLVGVAIFIACLGLSRSLRTPMDPLPILADVPAFSLTERSGETVRKSDLLGRIWVADFIFTSCAGPCPTLSLRMQSLQLSLKEKYAETVRLVSFTLDPDYDTPSVLRTYARRYHADAEQWLFLTGDGDSDIHTLVKKGFLQTVMPASDGNPIIHSTYYVLVDRAGRIRAFFDGLDPESKGCILQSIDALLQEDAGDD